MIEDIFFDGKRYIPVSTASKNTGYAKDYIGQLCRLGKVDSRRVGRVWYVSQESINDYADSTDPAGQDIENVFVPEKISHPIESYSQTNSTVIGQNFVPQKSAHTLDLKNHNGLSEYKSNLPRASAVSIKKVGSVAFIAILFVGGIYYFRNSLTGRESYRNVTTQENVIKVKDGIDNINNIKNGNNISSVFPKSKNIAFVFASDFYNSVNNFVYSYLYGPFTNFESRPLPRRNIAVVSNEVLEPEVVPKITQSSSPIAPAKVIVNPPQNYITQVVNKTNVVERIIERVVEAGPNNDYLESRLQEMNNKFLSMFSSQPTGSGGNITNVYQQIAQSQKIDLLSNTRITIPTITGGSITDASVSAASLSVSGPVSF